MQLHRHLNMLIMSFGGLLFLCKAVNYILSVWISFIFVRYFLSNFLNNVIEKRHSRYALFYLSGNGPWTGSQNKKGLYEHV